MRILWLTQFDYSSDLEAIFAWVMEIRKRKVEVDFFINQLPAYMQRKMQEEAQKVDNRKFKLFFNINSQQLKNILHYYSYHLLHVHHSSLYPLVSLLSHSIKIPWIASCFEEIDCRKITHLENARYLVCTNSSSLNSVETALAPFKKNNYQLILPAVKSESAMVADKANSDVLYIGGLAAEQEIFFSNLYQKLKEFDFPGKIDAVSWHKPSSFRGKIYSWENIIKLQEIMKNYGTILSYGYYLLQGMAAGKNALLMENGYGGIICPSAQNNVPDLRYKKKSNWNEDVQEKLKNDILKILKPSFGKKLRQDCLKYVQENHDPAIAAEKIARLYRFVLQNP